MIYYDLLQFITIYYNLLQFITIYYNLLWFIINYKPNYLLPISRPSLIPSHCHTLKIHSLSNLSTDLPICQNHPTRWWVNSFKSHQTWWCHQSLSFNEEGQGEQWLWAIELLHYWVDPCVLMTWRMAMSPSEWDHSASQSMTGGVAGQHE